MTSKKIVTFHDLQKKSVFITGGGSGIGAAITEGFVAQGASVSFMQRSDAASFCDRLQRTYSNEPKFIKGDVTKISELQRAIGEAEKINGKISVLINNAANDVRHNTLNVTEKFWDASQAINLKSYFFASQAVITGMISLGGGSIINMSSISYMMGNLGYPSYVAANSGINGMTRGLAREFGPNKIRVNSLAPGWVMTDKQKKLWVTKQALEEHLKRQCLSDPLIPEDIVGSVLFLASDISKSITGQMLAVDGGVVTTG